MTAKETTITVSSGGKEYEQDYYLWLQETAHKLRSQEWSDLDVENLIEEIESLGRSEKKELKSRLITLIEHLLKLQYWEAEKADNARGWRNTIVEQRRQIELSLEESPSLKGMLAEVFLDYYNKARKDTLRKYQFPEEIFPLNPDFTLEDVLNPDYFE
jgi:hypothetical protein